MLVADGGFLTNSASINSLLSGRFSKEGHISLVNCRKLGLFHHILQDNNLISHEGRPPGLSGLGEYLQVAYDDTFGIYAM